MVAESARILVNKAEIILAKVPENPTEVVVAEIY
jgi:hypothetical protein